MLQQGERAGRGGLVDGIPEVSRRPRTGSGPSASEKGKIHRLAIVRPRHAPMGLRRWKGVRPSTGPVPQLTASPLP